jgi:ribonucleoside-diphosphate reductase beta chain
MLPVEHPKLWEHYKTTEHLFWTAEEIDLAQDINHWEKLTDDERHYISHVLAFFAASDGIVNENLAVNFYNDVQLSEARAFYAVQIMIETIHSETYSLLIDTYIKNKEEKMKLFQAIETLPIIGEKAKWAMKWINSDATFAERLLAFAVVEGIFFSGSFCSIYWLKKRGLMPGLTMSNELISRDEGMHCMFAVEIYNMLEYQLEENTVHDLFYGAVELEKAFIREALPVKLIGMSAESMSQYIEYVCDYWLKELGYNPIYNTSNPFEWMSLISLEQKTSFFESRVSSYHKANHNNSKSEIDWDSAFV